MNLLGDNLFRDTGGSSGMSRLESQMSQRFELRDEAACETLDFRLPPREKFKHEAGLKRARPNEHMEPQVPACKENVCRGPRN